VGAAPADASLGRHRRWLALIGRHQVGSIVATTVDFTTMILLVELARLSPVLGTALGATAGAVTNFTMGRHWIFAAAGGALAPQAVRYALVSGASAGWNTLGEHVLYDLAGVRYVAARTMVAIVVSLVWNFPLQRWFVFHARHTT
jgi:putative flippase GtrA